VAEGTRLSPCYRFFGFYLNTHPAKIVPEKRFFEGAPGLLFIDLLAGFLSMRVWVQFTENRQVMSMKI
jgi:hypothetical protein